MASKFIHMRGGQIRRMDYRPPNEIQIVNPTIDRGTPPRDIKKRDIIAVPITFQRGTWMLEHMARFSPLRGKSAH